jgi:hypothetical protein
MTLDLDDDEKVALIELLRGTVAAGPGRQSGPFPIPGDGRSLPGFPGSYRVRAKTRMPSGILRPRWRTADDRILEWDYQHGTAEAYDGRRGVHQGEYDPLTGRMLKGAVAGRRVDP